MSAIEQALTSALLHFVWQGLVVAFLLWVTLFALRRRSAQARYLAALAAMAAMLLLPFVTLMRAYRSPSTASMIFRNVAAIPADLVKVALQHPPLGPTWLAALKTWALPVWAFGVLIFALRAVWGCGRISRMRRRAVPAAPEVLAQVAAIGARLGLERPAKVLMAAFAGSPSVIGWLRPVILLPPATLLGLTQEQLEAVLAHELAHIRRHDSLVNAAQILVETLLFYHPAVWWASARIREERELCCDDLAVRSCGDALCYARALTKLERLRITVPALALGSTGDPLAYRIRRLMGAGTRQDAPSKLPGVLALTLGIICLAANVHWARGQEQKAVSPRIEPASDTIRNSEVLSTAVESTIQLQSKPDVELLVDDQDRQQDQRRAEIEVLRQRVRELEEQFSGRRLGDAQASIQAQAQLLEDQAGRLNEQKSSLEIQLQNLNQMLNSAQQKLASLQTQFRDGYPDVGAQKERVAQLQDNIAAIQRQLQNRNMNQDVTARRLQELAGRLSESQQNSELQQQRLNQVQALERLAEQQHELTASRLSNTNWTVKSIDIVGLSAERRDALAARLPVKLGSKFAAGSVDAIAAALKDFDEHLTFTVMLGSNGEAVIHIGRPRI